MPWIQRARVLLLCIAVAAIVLVVSVQPSKGILAIAGLFAIGVLAWGVRWTMVDPCWLIFALVLEETCPYLNLLPFDPESRWWIRYPILLSLCVPAIPAIWKSGILKQGYFLALLGFFAWAGVSVAYSSHFAVSAGRLFPTVILFAALSLIASRVRSAGDVRKVLERYLMACAVLVALNMVALIFFGGVYIEGESSPIGIHTWVADDAGILRFCGFLAQPNAIGSLMFATVSVGLVLWAVFQGWRRGALLLLMAASVVLGVLADSRSNFIALAVGLASLTVWKYRLRGLLGCIAIIAVLIGIYLSLGRASKTYFNRDITTLTGRTMIWHFEAKKLAESPLVGYGYDVEGSIFEDPRFPDWTDAFSGGPDVSLHNGYLSVAIGMGIPALVFWLFVFMAPWVSLLRRRRDDWGLIPVFLVITVPAVIHAFGESGLAEPRYPEGLLVFLCWAMAERYRLACKAADWSRRFVTRTTHGVNFQRLLAAD